MEYVVHNENALGYLFSSGTLSMMGVLAGSVIRGGPDWRDGPIVLLDSDKKNLRPATQKDFDFFRVSSKGHIS